MMKVKEIESWLETQHQKAKIRASGPITSQQIEGEKVETWTDFIFLGSKITVDNDCSYEITRRLLLGRKAMTNLESILKSTDIWRGRWEGALRWGTHVNPWLIHVNVWQKPLQYCKVISLQIIKIIGDKKKDLEI